MAECTYLNPQLVLPRTLALLFSGSAIYIGWIDPQVRDAHPNLRSRLTHWKTMFELSKKFMGTLAFLGVLAGLNAYRVSQEKYWLYGSLTMFTIFPYTSLVLGETNASLLETAEKSGTEIDVSQKEGVVEKLKLWVKKHRVRAFLALTASVIYYIAEGKSDIIQKSTPAETAVKAATTA